MMTIGYGPGPHGSARPYAICRGGSGGLASWTTSMRRADQMVPVVVPRAVRARNGFRAAIDEALTYRALSHLDQWPRR
jgi:hypothetical protein